MIREHSLRPLACGLYAVNNLNAEAGQTAVVFGPGPIGLMMVQVPKKPRFEKTSYSSETAIIAWTVVRKLGADAVVNVSDTNSPHYVEDLGL